MNRFGRRIAKLERVEKRARPYKVAIRFEGPGSEKLTQPTQEELDEAAHIILVRSVEPTGISGLSLMA
jgi:hypothetical protein